MNQSTDVTNPGVNWRQVGLFLSLTFAFTLAVDLLLWKTIGYSGNASTVITLQYQMTLPAFFAILLGLFVFKNSPIYFRIFTEKSRYFFYFFLFYSGAYAVLTFLALFNPRQGVVLSAIGSSLTLLTLLVLLALRGFSGREAFARAGLSGGRARDWVVTGLAVVGYFTLTTLLNALFGLGDRVDVPALMESLKLNAGSTAGASMSPGVFLLVLGLQTIVIGSLIGLPLAFGEEYGWRQYLQNELVRLGKKRGVLLLGVIWGVWHYPVILMGHNYPGQPVWGLILMTLNTILLAYILGHLMLKTGSIWLVSFLHAIIDQTAAYFTTVIFRPTDAVWSFTMGVYALPLLAIVVALLLRDPVWREDAPVKPVPVQIEG